MCFFKTKTSVNGIYAWLHLLANKTAKCLNLCLAWGFIAEAKFKQNLIIEENSCNFFVWGGKKESVPLLTLLGSSMGSLAGKGNKIKPQK